MQVCSGCPFLELVEKREPNACEKIHSIPISDAVVKLLAAKAAQNLRPKYLTSLRQYLTQFIRGRETILMSSISIETIENWFLLRHEAPVSQNSNVGRLASLFSFAVKRGWMRENPCDKMDRVYVDMKLPAILTIEQSAQLLQSCPKNIRPYLTLALFAGIRPDEIMRMNWADINLETRTVSVDGKTRRRRIVRLEQIAVDLLKNHAEQSGPVAPSKSTIRRWRKIAREFIGGKWTADILRHTAASMLLAKYGDAGKVATLLGNSPQILLTHYNNPVAANEAERFWSILPK